MWLQTVPIASCLLMFVMTRSNILNTKICIYLFMYLIIYLLTGQKNTQTLLDATVIFCSAFLIKIM